LQVWNWSNRSLCVVGSRINIGISILLIGFLTLIPRPMMPNVEKSINRYFKPITITHHCDLLYLWKFSSTGDYFSSGWIGNLPIPVDFCSKYPMGRRNPWKFEFLKFLYIGFETSSSYFGEQLEFIVATVANPVFLNQWDFFPFIGSVDKIVQILVETFKINNFWYQ